MCTYAFSEIESSSFSEFLTFRELPVRPSASFDSSKEAHFLHLSMCLVEVTPGPPKPQASCALPAMSVFPLC